MKRFHFLKGPPTSKINERISDSTLCVSVGSRGPGRELSFFVVCSPVLDTGLRVKSTVWQHWLGLWDFKWTWAEEAL